MPTLPASLAFRRHSELHSLLVFSGWSDLCEPRCERSPPLPSERPPGYKTEENSAYW